MRTYKSARCWMDFWQRLEDELRGLYVAVLDTLRLHGQSPVVCDSMDYCHAFALRILTLIRILVRDEDITYPEEMLNVGDLNPEAERLLRKVLDEFGVKFQRPCRVLYRKGKHTYETVRVEFCCNDMRRAYGDESVIEFESDRDEPPAVILWNHLVGDEWEKIGPIRYCPFCGARIEVEEADE